MHEKTSEIIEKASKMANLRYKRLAQDIDAYMITTAQGASFMSSLWNIYPTIRGTDASLFRYKELCHKALRAWDIGSVNTEYLGADLSSLPHRIKMSAIDYPCVVKINAGSGSQGIHILRSQDQAERLSKTISTTDTDYCLQPFIDASEYRILIENGLVRFLYKKRFVSGDKLDRSENVLDTSFTPRFESIPEYIQTWAYNLYKKTSAPIIGADVFLHEDIDASQDILILELNHNPGLGILYSSGYEVEIISLLSSIFTSQ